MALLLVLFGGWTAINASPMPRMTPEREAKCRKTAQFAKMCRRCDAPTADRCTADVPNHGSAPKFMALVHAIHAMEKACGFEIPATSCVRGMLRWVPRICRGERIPDLMVFVEPGNCD